MNSNTELIADLQSNIVGDPFPLMRKAADAIEELEAENASITNDALKFVAERDALQAEVERSSAYNKRLEGYNNSLIEQRDTLKSLAVMEFNEDEVPSFTQGYHPHELTTAVTADRCSVLVKMITDLRAQLAAAQGQLKHLPAAPIPQQVATAPSSLPLLSEAFRTTESNGASSDYRMVFKFKDLASLHSADDEWRKFKGAV